MGRDELARAAGAGRTPPVSYPLYGRLFRSLAAQFGVKSLVAGASRPGFPEALWPEPGPSKPKAQ
jgi:hypothetical protein